MILVYDLSDAISSQIGLFADDTALYLTIDGKQNEETQHDLDNLSIWESDWDMEFNPSKCQVMQVPESRKSINATYRLNDQVLEMVVCAKYLKVDISNGLSWNSHIDSDNKTTSFINRNIKTKMPGVREITYNTLVRPQRDYAAPVWGVSVWDPHTKDKPFQIENYYERSVSVSSMI